MLRSVFSGAGVILLLMASGTYGFLLETRHIFPFKLLKYARLRLNPPKGATREPHPERAAETPSLDAIRHLANLPYLEGYSPPTAGGVIRAYDRTLVQDGLNFFTSGNAPEAILMDMDGKVVKRWTADALKAIPGVQLSTSHSGHESFLRDAQLLPDGGIIGMFDEIGVVRLDASSRVEWVWRGPVHHDLCLDEEGHAWSILHERRVVPELNRVEPVLDDFFVELSSEGKLLRRMSLADSFLRSRYAAMLLDIPAFSEDVFHTNSIVVLDGSAAGRLPAFRRGNLLVSIKRLNAVAVIDPDARKVVWALAGQWYGQHSARLLPSGHVLLFDNLGTMRPASRVLEVDPVTQQVIWSFGGRDGENILSETVGFVERLGNGNTLITESDRGRVLEVTPDHRVVWEFVNPALVGKHKEHVAIVYFMERVSRDQPFLTREVSEARASPGPEHPR
ncbi:MAG TPA: arylsulfotransferase family protein [Thermoanaerobaculia bacterium]